jgi:three-Cys-motif partner protein
MARSLDKPVPEDDGLLIPEVGNWSEDKYNLIWLYDKMFSTGMKNIFQNRVYVDLYSGAGMSRIRGTKTLVYGSPLLALQVNDPFTKYVFCEEDKEKFLALSARANKIAPNGDIVLIQGRCDDNVDGIRKAIPRASPTNKVLTLCVVDPYSLEVKFDTIKALASGFVDFLMLFMTMDANMNADLYANGPRNRIDEMLCDPNWRMRWSRAKLEGVAFRDFVANEFSSCMRQLGYLDPPQTKTIRNTERNSPMYRLALYSRHPKAHYFWEEALDYSDDQPKLF